MLNGEMWLGENERPDYKKFFGQDGKEIEKIIRQRTSNGRPVGGEQFVELIEQKLGHMLAFFFQQTSYYFFFFATNYFSSP